MLMVDVAVLAGERTPEVLLVQRAYEPFAGEWALPGGFVEQGERALDAAPRELAEETGLRVGELELLGVYDTPGRDPRGWSVSVVYLVALPAETPSPEPTTRAMPAGSRPMRCRRSRSTTRRSCATRWPAGPCAQDLSRLSVIPKIRHSPRS